MREIIKKYSSILVVLCVAILFFYKFFFFGLIPFPGDLLVGNYEPYKSEIPGIPHKGQGADVIRELYPWKYFTIEQIKKGELPLWNPYVFSGNPHLSNLQSGAFYPLNILFFLLPFIPAWSIYIILQYVGMMLFMYVYLRQINLGKIASLMGGVSFAFSGFMVVWGWYGNLGHALMFLPLILFSIEKLYASPKIKWVVLCVFSLTFSVFAGYIQFTMYVYLLTFLYAVFRLFSFGKEKNLFAFIIIVLSFGLSVLLSSIQLLPLYEIVSNSLRATYSYNVLLERLMPPEAIITLLIPDFFGNPATMNYFLRGGSSLERASSIGLWPLLFAILALFSKRSFFKVFFVASAAVTYISTFSIPPLAYFHSIGIPFLSTGIPTRVLSIFCFSLSVLSAIGVDYYLKNPQKRKRMVKVVIFFAIVFILILAGTFYENTPNMDISRRNMVLPFGIFIFGSALLLIKQIPKKISVSILLLLTIFELFYFFQKFNSFVPSSYVYPQSNIIKTLQNIQGIDRFWGYGSASIDSNFQMIDKTFTTSGYDALYIKRYGELIAASKNGKFPTDVPRSVADILPGYGPSELKENPYRQRALDLTGVKYVLNKKNDPGIDSAFDQRIYDLTYQKNGWQMYANKQVLPRIHLFGRYQVLSEDEQIIEKLYSPFDFQNVLILEEKLADSFSIQPDKSAIISDIDYTPNKISFTVSSTEDQIVFLSDNYYPGWKAYIDGRKEKIYRANYTFRAVPVKAGKHTVEFVYEPASLFIGTILSGIGFFGLLILLIIVSMKKKHVKKG